jgi:hypothetical protein
MKTTEVAATLTQVTYYTYYQKIIVDVNKSARRGLLKNFCHKSYFRHHTSKQLSQVDAVNYSTDLKSYWINDPDIVIIKGNV